MLRQDEKSMLSNFEDEKDPRGLDNSVQLAATSLVS
jgi:hypothetical protein